MSCWDDIAREPIASAIVESLVDENAIAPLSGIRADEPLGAMTLLIIDSIRDAADFIWCYQLDRGESVSSVADILRKLCFSYDVEFPLIRHLLIELTKRYENITQTKTTEDFVDGVNRILRLTRGARKQRNNHPQSLESEYVFQKCGQKWVVTFSDDTIYLNDTVGPYYIRQLLLKPYIKIPVLEMLEAISGKPLTTYASHAGPQSDAKTVGEVKSKLKDLQEELEEADRNSDIASKLRLQPQIEALSDYLRETMGFGGRLRKASDDAGRARTRITNAIDRTINSIRNDLPAASQHFENSINTGRFMSYEPEERLDWVL